jgi:two-component system alkaline phosphatase synthesis response regulator PhoP
MPRILVVDDDKQIVRLVQSYLERAGYQVLTAQNGETALHTIRRERPDLIVLDLMLPDRDGWEITRMVRSDPTLAPLPIIMLTARVEDTDKIIGLELGADDYIAKPFNPHEVVARVRAVLRRATGAPIVSPVLQIRGLRMDVDRHIVTRDDAAIELTPTEFDLLKVMLSPAWSWWKRASATVTRAWTEPLTATSKICAASLNPIPANRLTSKPFMASATGSKENEEIH